MTPCNPLAKALIAYLFAFSAVGALALLWAWLPFAPSALRHWVRHWARVVEPGCNRCLLRLQRVEAERRAEEAFVSLSRRILARGAFGRVGAQ